jgi:hypothetical protein
MSKNAITITQLQLACRHVQEMIAAGVTENLAIRPLELFSDVYAKLRVLGSTSPHHVKYVKLWSIKARALRDALPNAKPKDYFRVEHGTPQRSFARTVLSLYQNGELDEVTMDALVQRVYRLAVITIEEDKTLNKMARSTVSTTPKARWRDAGIEFDPRNGG